MQRRKFLNLGALVGLSTLLSSSLHAVNFRQSRPEAWTAHTVDDAIAKLYPNQVIHEGGVELSVPKIATNGGSVPVNVSSSLEAKSIALFQDTNPEAAVIALSIHKNSIIDYDFKLKLKSDGSTPIKITAVLEDLNGALHISSKELIVPSGTCDG